MARVSDLLNALFSTADGVVELRAFEPNAHGCSARLFAEFDDSRIGTFYQENRERNLFWGVATRRQPGGGSLADCLHLSAVFADLDFKLAASASDVRRRLAQFPLAPSLVIASGGGRQPYWFLREPADVPAQAGVLRDILRRLAAHLGGDLIAAEPARILRVPGSWNRKYEPARLVVVESFTPDRRFNLSEFDWLPAVPQGTQCEPVDLSRVVAEFRNQTLYRLARGLKGKRLPGRVIDVTIRVVNRECCQPPLDELELDRLLRNALTQPDRPMPTVRIIEVS
jgi:hypothetical protein